MSGEVFTSDSRSLTKIQPENWRNFSDFQNNKMPGIAFCVRPPYLLFFSSFISWDCVHCARGDRRKTENDVSGIFARVSWLIAKSYVLFTWLIFDVTSFKNVPELLFGWKTQFLTLLIRSKYNFSLIFDELPSAFSCCFSVTSFYLKNENRMAIWWRKKTLFSRFSLCTQKRSKKKRTRSIYARILYRCWCWMFNTRA